MDILCMCRTMPNSSVQIAIEAPTNDNDPQQPQSQEMPQPQEPQPQLEQPPEQPQPQEQQPQPEQQKTTGADRVSLGSTEGHQDWHRLFSIASTGSNEDHRDMQAIAHKTSLTILQVKLIFVVALPIIGLIGIAIKAVDTAASQYHTARRGSETLDAVIRLNRFIRNLQLERGVAVTFLISNGTLLESKSLLADYRKLVDESLAELTPWPSEMVVHDAALSTPEAIRGRLVELRLEVDGLTISFNDGIEGYSNLTNGLMTLSQSSLVVPDQGNIWPMVIAFHSLLRCIDVIGVERASGVMCLFTCNVSLDTFLNFRRIEGKAESLLTLAFVYQPNYENRYDDQFTRSGLETAIDGHKRHFMSREFKETCLNLSAEERVNTTTQWKSDMRLYEVLLEDYEMAMEKDTVTTIKQVTLSESHSFYSIPCIPCFVTPPFPHSSTKQRRAISVARLSEITLICRGKCNYM